ncbi:hypothetical protein HID58_093654 [Brassica napus]|uniref:Uncharacterized protein n=1 Tax=Brassica napus TaxID=3708 RepID=A0ABQ7XBX3_BRANA|nr:hypothetical protein HID58_093654 [Brassica napus]
MERHMRRNSSRDPPKSTHPIVYEKLNQHVDDEYEKLNFSRDGVKVTPTRVYFSGPEPYESNRVLDTMTKLLIYSKD